MPSAISLLILNILDICLLIRLLVVRRVRCVLLDANKVDCVIGSKTFSMERMGDEPCNASPIPFWLWEYGTSAYRG
jgi:hypothetical protein